MKFFRWVMVAGSVFAAAPAFAYIPRSHFIVTKMAAKRTGLRSVRITSQVSGFDSSGKPNGLKFKAVSFYFPATKTLKSEALDSNGTVLFGVEKRDKALPLSLLVLYDPYSKNLIEALRDAGIPIGEPEKERPIPDVSASPLALMSPEPSESPEPLSLKRWDASIAWVIGTSAQLWVEKDSFLPVRILTQDQDIQFTKYRYSQDLPYPRSTTLANRAGTLELEEDTQEVKANPPAKQMEQDIPSGYTSQGNSSPMKELIRKYYAGLR